MPKPICNTSPLQYLHQINQIDLLPEIYGSIQVPQAVADEITTGLHNDNDLPYLEDLYWLSIRPNEENADISQFPSGGECGYKFPGQYPRSEKRLVLQGDT